MRDTAYGIRSNEETKAPIKVGKKGASVDNVQFSEELGLRGEPKNFPKGQREWSAFNRSFANKTSDMKQGEERLISITTGSHVYFVTADGYMQGFAEQKILITRDMEIKRAEREEFNNGTDSNGKEPDNRTSELQHSRGGAGDGIHGSPGGISATGNASFFGKEQNGRTERDFERDTADSRLEEIEQEDIPGSFVLDGENSYYIDWDGKRKPFEIDFSEELTTLSDLRKDNERLRKQIVRLKGEMILQKVLQCTPLRSCTL